MRAVLAPQPRKTVGQDAALQVLAKCLFYIVPGRKPLFLKNYRPQNSGLEVVFWNCHARKGSGVHFRGRHARCCVFRARVAPEFCNPVVKKGVRPRLATRPACRSCLGQHSSSSASRALVAGVNQFMQSVVVAIQIEPSRRTPGSSTRACRGAQRTCSPWVPPGPRATRRLRCAAPSSCTRTEGPSKLENKANFGQPLLTFERRNGVPDDGRMQTIFYPKWASIDGQRFR